MQSQLFPNLIVIKIWVFRQNFFYFFAKVLYLPVVRCFYVPELLLLLYFVQILTKLRLIAPFFYQSAQRYLRYTILLCYLCYIYKLLFWVSVILELSSQLLSYCFRQNPGSSNFLFCTIIWLFLTQYLGSCVLTFRLL